VFALLRDAGVIDDPGHDGLLAGHGRQHLPHDGGEHGLVAPRRRAHQVLERLPRRLDAVRVEPGGHGFNRLALARQQQAAAVIFQGLFPVPVPRGFGQALQISREALFLRAWPRRSGSHETIIAQNVSFVTQ